MNVAIDIGFVLALLVIARLVVVCRSTLKDQRVTDPLTELPNRQGFEAIVATHVKRDKAFGILWVDLDEFRKLNELHGYASGDILLAQIGPRIRRCLRPGDAVARFGGDQFLVLVRGHDDIAGIARRILSAVNASAGVSLYPNHAASAEDLLRFAETAMRQAKSTARGQALIYEPRMAARSFRGSEIATLIQSALTNDHFHLVYQPIVDGDGEIVRMEALVRIEDPALGRVAPLEFIGVAEQTGLIHEVGVWILREACRQARDWREADFPTQVTINLSPLQVASNELADRILMEIAHSRIDPCALTLHITGAIASTAPVQRLRSAGIHISSTEPLFDEIKVRAPFAVPTGRPNLTVIAQGIETPEQLDSATATGCDLFQGFQIAPPLEPADATEILRTGLFAADNRLVGR